MTSNSTNPLAGMDDPTGFKCASCATTFPDDLNTCYNCDSEHLLPIDRRGTATGCELCGGQVQIETHHTQYFPEETIEVCKTCHTRIHHEEGFYDGLEPERKRPDNYESKLRTYKTRQNPDKFECVNCGDRFVAADCYPVKEETGRFPETRDAVACHSCLIEVV